MSELQADMTAQFELAEEHDEIIDVTLQDTGTLVPSPDEQLVPDHSLANSRLLNNLAVRAQNGDNFAANELVTQCMRYVRIRVAQSGYYMKGGTDEDLYQHAMMGLSEAIGKYDISKGNFLGYASMFINSRMIDAIKTSNRLRQRSLNEAASLDAPTSLPSEPFGEGGSLSEMIDGEKEDVERRIVATETLKEFKVCV